MTNKTLTSVPTAAQHASAGIDPEGPAVDADRKGRHFHISKAGLTEATWRGARGCAWLLGEVTAIVLGAAVVWMAAINILLAKRTVDVSFLHADAARWFSSAFDGKAADIGKMTLQWEAADNTVVFRAADIAVRDTEGAVLNTITSIESTLAMRDLAGLRIDPIRVAVDGGKISWVRDANGAFQSGLGTPETVGQFGPIWSGQKNDGNRDLDLGRLASVDIKNATLYIRDALSDYEAQLDSSQLKIDITDGDINFAMQANLITQEQAGLSGSDGEAALEGTALDLKGAISPDLEDFNVRLTGAALNPTQSLPRKGRFAGLSFIDAPIDFDAALVSKRGQGLQAFEVSARAGAGQLKLDRGAAAFERASLSAEFNPNTEQLQFTEFAVKSDAVAFEGGATLTNIGTPASGMFNKDTQFEVKLPIFKWDAAALDIDPLNLSNLSVSGQVLTEVNQIQIDEISASFGSFAPSFSGRISRGEDGQLTAVKAQGRIDGTVSIQQLLSLWPRNKMIGGREWMVRSILAADMTNFDVVLDFDEAVLSGESLRNENLEASFDLTGGKIQYIATMTPIEDAVGKGVLLGNKADFAFERGRIADVMLGQGTVSIPIIFPSGGDLIVNGTGAGPAQTLIGLLDQKPFEYVTPYGVNPSDFSGEGEIEILITRPLRRQITYDEVDFKVSGTMSNISAPFSVGANRLKNGNVVLYADRAGLSVKGPVDIGPWQAGLEWTEVFDEGATPTRYLIEGRMNQSSLDSFGIGLREFIGGGDVYLSIDAGANGVEITQSDIRADLTDTDMRIGPYWDKPKGAPAEMSAVMSLTKDKDLLLRDLTLRAPGLELEGTLDIAEDYKLINLHLNKAKIDGFVDAGVQVKPGPDQDRFDIFVTGRFLDVSPFVSQAMSGSGDDLDVPVLLTASLETLTLNEAYVLQNASVLFAHNGIGITQARMKGEVIGGEFKVDLATDQANRLRDVMIDIPNASNAALAFFGIDSLTGGRLQINADLPLVGGVGPLRGAAEIEDVKLINAPIMTTILSLASLQGLADALGGAGLNFTRLDIPFSYDAGVLSVRDARASGSALGMTASGEIGFAQRVVDIDGVLVPAYTANSMLGSIPVIGDIFVGKKGEGVFALSYTVRGKFDEAQVAVNPLSALTPGFLRNIFTPKRDDLPEGLRSAIEAVRPPEKTDN